jgi:hypothetical protein
MKVIENLIGQTFSDILSSSSELEGFISYLYYQDDEELGDIADEITDLVFLIEREAQTFATKNFHSSEPQSYNEDYLVSLIEEIDYDAKGAVEICSLLVQALEEAESTIYDVLYKYGLLQGGETIFEEEFGFLFEAREAAETISLKCEEVLGKVKAILQ